MNFIRLTRFVPALAALALLPACDAKKPTVSTAAVDGAPPPAAPVMVEQVSPVPATVIDPSADLYTTVKEATHAKRDTLRPAGERFEQRVETELAALKAKGTDVDVEAEKKLSDARTQVTKVLSELSDAAAETWPTAQAHALAVLQEFRNAWAAVKSPRSTS